MLLMYYRTHTTHALFGIDQSSVCRNINPLEPLLAGIFRIPVASERYRTDRRRHTVIIKNVAGPHNLMHA